MDIQKFFGDNKYAISWGIMAILILSLFGSVYLITKTVSEIRTTSNQPYYNSINVTGEGEILSVPDVATFNFTINEASESVDTAQQMATEKVNKVVEYLKNNGIIEKDIKTISYNINPKYEWQQEPCPMGSFSCPGGNSVIIGYEVYQGVDIKIRDTQKAGEILMGIGKIGISNVSGLQFTTDDDSELMEQARKLAIEDAKSKMLEISKTLGVKPGRIIGYYEEGPVQPVYGMGGDMMMEAKAVSAVPQLPTGENKITSRVSVTFEIK